MAQDEELEALRDEIKRLRRKLSETTPDLKSMLRLRGFKVHGKEPPEDLLLPAQKHISEYYGMLKKYSFRLFIRDVIKRQEHFTVKDVTRYSTADITEDYIRYLLKVGLARRFEKGFRLSKRPVKSFGPTLEWLLSEILKRDFATEAIWGVTFKGQKVGGDYDLIAKIDGSLLYMEVKSSPPKQIYDNEISAFMDRVEDLAAEVSIFLMDTELRMKDKIVPMFEEELKRRHKKPPEIKRMVKELFQISDKIFIINAKGSITANIEKALTWYFRRKI
jgi:hypothetical protein